MFTSTEKEITLNERFNKDVLKYIILNGNEFRRRLALLRKRKDKTYNPITLAKQLYARSNGQDIKVVYKFAKGETSGRRFAAVSMQGMQRELRHTIAHEFYNDLDIVNCHPVILSQLCKKYKIESKCLDKYVRHREKFLRDNNLTKTDIVSFVNGGFRISVAVDNWTSETHKFFNESKKIRSAVCDLFPAEFAEQTKKNKLRKKDWNHDGTFVNKMLTEYEDKILMCIADGLFSEDGKKNGVLCFDGIMVPKSVKIDFEDLEKRVLDRLNFEIKLKVKPMNEGFTITPEMLETVADLSDVFDFSYFRSKVKTITTEKELLKLNREIIEWMNSQYQIIKDTKSYTLQVFPGDTCPHTGFVSRKYCSKFADSLKKVDFANKHLTTPPIEIEKDGKKTTTTVTIKPYEMWNKSPLRLEYDGIEFNPVKYYKEKKAMFKDDRSCPSFNKFHGLAIEKKQAVAHGKALDESHGFFQHIKKRWCLNNKEVYEYVLNWFAHCIQRPGIKMKSAMVLKSAERSGKGIIVQIIAQLLGDTYFFQPGDADEVLGNFNSSMEGILMLFLDEMVWGGDKDKAGTLKKLVSEAKGSLKVKFLSNRKISQLFNLIIASNEAWVVPAGKTSTRWVILQLDDELALMKDEKQKQKILAEIGGVDRFALAKFFHTRDISNFNPTDIPKTEALREQKILSLPKLESWWYTQIFNDNLDFGKPVSKTKMYDSYIEDSKDRHMSSPMFYKNLFRVSGELPTKRTCVNGKRERCVILPSLGDARQTWRDINCDQDWKFNEDESKYDCDTDDDEDVSDIQP